MLHSTEMHSLNSKTNEYLAGWQRARAELMNFRQRVASVQEDKDKQAKRQVVAELIPLTDNFQAMCDHLPSELADHPWAQGVLHVAKQLEAILAQYNVTAIKTNNTKFDPALHEAVESVTHKKFTSGSIVAVVQTGYTMDDEVIRPARVKVAK